MRIKEENVAGIIDDQGKITCKECMSDDDVQNSNQNEVLLQKTVDESNDFFYCDVCGKNLSSK